MNITLGDLVTPANVTFNLQATNKRDTLLALARQAATLSGQNEHLAADIIFAREALGSTGFGAGTAIPHGRLPTLTNIITVFAKLASPVDYAALDGLPVDIIVLMLAPTAEGVDHLKVLARISRALRNREFCNDLRGSATSEAFYTILNGSVRSEAA